ncbi:RloB family protein [Streptomyces coelicoflavus]|uniref:RloB family protein n=1 Tax=Streptomyces coelicoflavus TaxID=285562 RepID=UPI003668E4DF
MPILVVCGAKNTEPAYLKGLLAAVDNRAVAVRIKICDQDPVSVVRHTVTERDRARGHYDRAWCVLDVDEFAHLDEALRLAVDEDVQVALSNRAVPAYVGLVVTEVEEEPQLDPGKAAPRLPPPELQQGGSRVRLRSLSRRVEGSRRASAEAGAYGRGSQDEPVERHVAADR